MLRIGDFSKLGRVTIKALKVYEREGLLLPAHVASNSGYRFYEASQLARLNRVKVMKDLGLSLAEIRDLLLHDASDERVKQVLEDKRNAAQERVDEELRRLMLIEQRLDALHVEPETSIEDVVVRPLEPTSFHAVRYDCPDQMHGVMFMLQLVRAASSHRRTKSARFLAVGHDDCFAETQSKLEFGFIGVDGEAPLELAETPLLRSNLDGHPRAATVVRSGSLSSHLVATANVARWLDANGLQLAGPHRELMIEVDTDAPANATVELQFPVAPIEHPVSA